MKFTEFKMNAPAKINLNLHVTGKRKDGYHLLNSLVCFTDIGDVINFAPAKQYSLTIKGVYADALQNKENIITKAIYNLCEGLPAISLTLTKNLPIASGIGGGSSNAAAALLGVSKALDINRNLYPLALALGADVPMCLNRQSCIVQGIGEELDPIKLPNLYMVLINPNIPISTPNIFKEYAKQPHYKNKCTLPNVCKQNNLINFLNTTENDLQPTAIDICPKINIILQSLNKENGCILSRMSGSGATCFGIFKDLKTSHIAKHNLEKKYPKWWIRDTVTL